MRRARNDASQTLKHFVIGTSLSPVRPLRQQSLHLP
jgi:hypothetical protein